MIPRRLRRMAPLKNFSFLRTESTFDSDRVRLTLEDIERRGPGLLIDQKDCRRHQAVLRRRDAFFSSQLLAPIRSSHRTA